MKQVLKIFIFLIILLSSFTVTSNASLDWDTIHTQAGQFISAGQGAGSAINATSLVNSASNILTTIGVVVVLVGILVIGIRYMVATPEEAAKLKTKLVGLAISGAVIIGAYGIWKLAYYFFAGLTN